MANLRPFARNTITGQFAPVSTSDVLVDTSGNPIVPSGPRTVQQTNSISLTAAGANTIFTVPSGKTFIPSRCIVVITAGSGITVDAVADVRVTSSGDIFASQTLTNVRSANDIFVFDISSAKSLTVAAASNIVLQVTTAATGTTLTASVYLQGWYTSETTGQGGGFSDPFIGCHLRKTSNQSVATSVTTNILFDSEFTDTNGFHSTVTNTDRITIPSGYGGYYELYGSIWFSFNANNARACNIAHYNSSGTLQRFTVNLSAPITVVHSVALHMSPCVYYAVPGDYFVMQGYQESGSTLTVGGDSTYDSHTRFCARKLNI